MELLLNSDVMRSLPIGLSEIVSPMQLQSHELKKLDKIMSSSELIEITSVISESSATVCDIVDTFYKSVRKFRENSKNQGIWADIKAQELLDLVLRLQKFLGIFIKSSVSAEVLRKLNAYHNILDIGSIKVYLR
jgi:hypothetical protein